MPTKEQYWANPRRYAAYFQKHYKNNRDKVCERTRKWREKNPEKVREMRFKNKFGITTHQYNDMLQKQNGVCAICQSMDQTKALAVDRSHYTGTIRGLLCQKCNVGLGNFKYRRDLLLKAVDYLRDYERS